MHIRAALRRFAPLVLATLAVPLPGKADEAGKAYSFGVVNQRSPVLHAQCWNPILRYVSDKSGVALQLKLAKTAPEHSAMIGRGEFDFIYSNHNFTPTNAGEALPLSPGGRTMKNTASAVPARSASSAPR